MTFCFRTMLFLLAFASGLPTAGYAQTPPPGELPLQVQPPPAAPQPPAGAVRVRPGFDRVLGLVENGLFRQLSVNGIKSAVFGAPLSLTTIPRYAAQPPQAAPLDLRRFEGLAVMLEGHADSSWLYSARIIDAAGPILTSVIRRSYGIVK